MLRPKHTATAQSARIVVGLVVQGLGLAKDDWLALSLGRHAESAVTNAKPSTYCAQQLPS
jgi:hypothetical protein